MSSDTTPECFGYTILYNDENIIAVNKKTGVVVIPSRGEPPELSLKNRIEQDLQERLFTVHRIDKGTSGVVVFAKNADTHKMLNTQFEHHLVNKKYRALVQGTMVDRYCCKEPIREFGSGRMGVHPNGKPSETRITVIKTYDKVTLVQAFPLTGRRHQIRVHLYHGGFPIIGDDLYGHDRPVGGANRLMLHAEELCIQYPGGMSFTFNALVDSSWDSVLSELTAIPRFEP